MDICDMAKKGMIGFLLVLSIFFLFGYLLIDKLIVHYKIKSIGTQQENAIRALVRQAARWSTAAEQDENSMIAVLHANYGAGYLWALKDIATDQEIEKATNIKITEFERAIISVQDMATKRMARLCPKYAPEPTYLTKLGGEGN